MHDDEDDNWPIFDLDRDRVEVPPFLPDHRKILAEILTALEA